MKLILIAVLLIFSGIICFSTPYSLVYGIICVTIGAAMLLYKFILFNAKLSRSNSTYDTSSQSASRVVNEALAYHDAFTTAQPYIRKASEYSDKIRALKSSAAPNKDPNTPQVDDLISLCDEAMEYYTESRHVFLRLSKMQENELAPYNEGTYCLFPAAECLVNIYLLRKQFVKAESVIKLLISLNISGDMNISKIDKLVNQLHIGQIRAIKYPYTMDECIAEINERITLSDIDVSYPSKAKNFNRSHFQDICEYYNLKNSEDYAFNTAVDMNGNLVKTKSYTYSP